MRRASVLMLTLLVLAMLSLAAAAALSSTGVGLESAAAMQRRTSSRALAWSGVQAAMAELAAQRKELIDGSQPALTREWELFAEDGRRAVIRLVHADSADGTQGLEPPAATSEAAKLNINAATRDMLAAHASVGMELADAIVAGRPWSSVESLLTLPGVTSEQMYGVDNAEDAARRASGAAMSVAQDQASTSSSAGEALIDILTAGSFDPAVQGGLEAGRQSLGKQRININVPWSERLGKAVEARFGEATAKALRGLLRDGRRFERPSDIAAELRTQGLPIEGWSELLDGFATGDDLYVPGRVDLNTASEAVLACIPGIGADAARAIVAARARLDLSQRRGVAWPVAEGVLTPDNFVQACDWLTTRSMQWRVRVECGFSGAVEATSASGSGEPLQDACVVEAIIDVASERPRVAYLREVTMLHVARAMEQALRNDAKSRAGDEVSGEEEFVSDSAAPAAPEGETMSGEMNDSFDADLDFSGPGTGAAGTASEEEAADAGSGGRMAEQESAVDGGDRELQDRRTGRWRGGGSGGGASQRGTEGSGGAEGGSSW